MKKILVFSFAILTILLAIQCSPKTSKSTAGSNDNTKSNASSKPEAVEPPKPASIPSTQLPTENADAALAMKERLNEGEQLFSTSCKKCHKLYAPSSRTAQEWKPILVVMTGKAKLSDTETSKVADYIYSSCKK